MCRPASCVARRLIVCPPVSELHNTAALPSNTARRSGKSGQPAAGAPIEGDPQYKTGLFLEPDFGFVHFSMILIRVQHFFLFSPSRQI